MGDLELIKNAILPEYRYLPDTGADPCAAPKGFATGREAEKWCDEQGYTDVCIWKRGAASKKTSYTIAAVKVQGVWVLKTSGAIT